MLSKQTALIGAGALAVGSIFGHLVSGPGGAAKRAIEELQTAGSAMSKQIADLTSDRDALSEQLAKLGADQTAMAEAQTALRGQVSGFDGQIAQMQETATAQTAKVAASVYALETSMAALKSAPATAPATVAAAAAESATASVKPAKAAAAPSGPATIPGPGHTAKLSDKLRVFLAGTDADAGRAQAAINGFKRVTLRKDQPFGVMAGDEFCHVTLTGLEGRAALVDHACGADVPAPLGLRAGETLIFEDAGIRAFIGGVDQASGSALVAVNGFDRHMVDYDTPLRVKGASGSCHLSLSNIDRGYADLALNC